MYIINIETNDAMKTVEADSSTEASYIIAKFLLFFSKIENKVNNKSFTVCKEYSTYMIEKLKASRLVALTKELDDELEAKQELEDELDSRFSLLSKNIEKYKEGSTLVWFKNSSSYLRWLFTHSSVTVVETIDDKDDKLNIYLTSPSFGKTRARPVDGTDEFDVGSMVKKPKK